MKPESPPIDLNSEHINTPIKQEISLFDLDLNTENLDFSKIANY